MVQPYVLRRAEFLLNEARCRDSKYDQTVRYALRVISNNLCCGADGSSSFVKWNIKYISKIAYELYLNSTDEEWHKNTTNEHQKPISQIWQWIKENAHTISPQDIIKEMRKYPMVVLHNDENSKLNKSYRSEGSPDVRYKDIQFLDIGPLQKRKSTKPSSEA